MVTLHELTRTIQSALENCSTAGCDFKKKEYDDAVSTLRDAEEDLEDALDKVSELIAQARDKQNDTMSH